MKINKKKLKSIILTSTVLIILALGSNGAQALTLYLSEPTVSEQNATMTAEMDLDANDRLPGTYNVTLTITHSNGTIMEECKLGVGGPVGDSCNNFQITVINGDWQTLTTGGYSYSYGYGYGSNYKPQGYYNVSFGYINAQGGLGYNYGYDYGTIRGSEIKLIYVYTAPEVNSDTTYTVSFTYDTNEFQYTTLADKTFTIQGVTQEEQSQQQQSSPYPFTTLTSDDTDDTLTELQNTLGSDVESYTEVASTTTDETISINADTISETFSSYGDDVVNAILNRMSGRETVSVSITTTVQVLQITKSDGTIANYTRISRTFNNLEELTVIEVIPKSAASSASQITGNFTIVEDDPVIEFTVEPSGSITYYLNGEADTSGISTIPTQLAEETIDEDEGTTPPTNDTGGEPEPVDTEGNYALIIGVIIAIIVIIVGITLLVKYKIIDI